MDVADAIAQRKNRGDMVFVDLRDPRKVEREGKIPSAFHCTRGMLEFWIDPESPYHKPIFAEPKRWPAFPFSVARCGRAVRIPACNNVATLLQRRGS